MDGDRNDSRGGLAVAVVCGALLAILVLACGGGGIFYVYTVRLQQQRAVENAYRAEAAARLAAEQAQAALEEAEAARKAAADSQANPQP